MKKGFTLIELLAVIVILAIIALIAVPLIMNMIEESRQKSAVVSGRNYVKAVNYKIAQEALNNNEVALGEYVIGENELEISADNIKNITGSYEIGKTGVLTAGLCVNNYSVEYSNGSAYIKKDVDYCSEGYVFKEPEATLLSDVCKNQSLYESKDKFKIYKVDDLVCLSNLVESGKNFSGKEIYLLRDININDTNNYAESNTTFYGDINGNGTVEELYSELTTGKGFKPIGNNNKKFSGTFLGYAYTISNLMINRNNQYLGLFGYNTGIIRGLNLKNVNISSTVSSDAYIGGLVGYNIGQINSVSVQGNISATSGGVVGGVVGYLSKTNNVGSKLESAMFSGNVSGSYLVGGLAGLSDGYSGSYNILKGLVYNSQLRGQNYINIYVGRTTYSTITGRNKNVTGNCSSDASTYIPTVTLEAIDGYVDTYIGGDDDSDGYYFDYDSEGNIILYSVERNPIENKLKGTGTQDKPYLIRNANDWKIASSTLNSAKYYSLTSDIDFTDTNFYVLGTATHKFKGNFNGNMNTISNISISGNSNLGIFGNNDGTIEGLKLDTIAINGYGQYLGSLVGKNTGTIKGIEARNITATFTKSGISADVFSGGLVGYSTTGKISSVDVQGTLSSTEGGVIGGVIGYLVQTNNTGVRLENAMFSGNISGSYLVGGLTGITEGNSASYNTLKGLVYDSQIRGQSYINIYSGRSTNSTITGRNKNVTGNCSSDATTSTPAVTLEAIDGYVDTIIGGDNDSDGYYFDYDSNGKVALYSTAITPITNTLKGSGTQSDPYQISSANDWKIASSTSTQDKYYVLKNDIDFTGKNFYVLGTNSNKFKGNFNGNMHTISNISISGNGYIGIFGNSEGTIEGLKLSNITINGYGQYNGTLAGRNSGTIKGIEARNISATFTKSGSTTDVFSGGLVGQNVGRISSVDVQANISSTEGGVIGGVTGYLLQSNNTGSKVENAIFKGNITASYLIGGLVGLSDGNSSSNNAIKGLVYDSQLRGQSYVNIYAGRNSNTTVTGRNKNVTGNCGSDATTYIPTVTIEAVDGYIDTLIGGDNDSDGYYFDYDSNGNLKLYSAPITNTLKGSGTQSDPYQISSANDWKIASSTSTQDKYYILKNDIDFSGKKFYPLGTNSNKFKGNFNGNMHTVSNVTISGNGYIGMFGNNEGTIEGLKLSNITINGYGQYNGTLAGRNSGTIKGIEARNITAAFTKSGSTADVFSGGLVGQNVGRINSVDVQANISSTEGGVIGGVTGHLLQSNNTGSKVENAIFKGNITASYLIGGLVGLSDGNSSSKNIIKGLVYDSQLRGQSYVNIYAGRNSNTTVTGKNKNVTGNCSSDSTTYISSITLEAIDGVVDTTIGGDNDSDGYYFGVSNGIPELLKVN